jgi:hypothetical protein
MPKAYSTLISPPALWALNGRFKSVQKLVRPMFPAFQANIAAYTVSLVAYRLGSHLDLEKIWPQQDISASLKQKTQGLGNRCGA